MTVYTEEFLDKIAEAIEEARCPGREGPYGLYDYSKYEGNEDPYCVRDFRDTRNDTYGKVVFRTNDPDKARAVYDKMTRQHIALAAIRAMSACLSPYPCYYKT